jgi:hypothetical protein
MAGDESSPGDSRVVEGPVSIKKPLETDSRDRTIIDAHIPRRKRCSNSGDVNYFPTLV